MSLSFKLLVIMFLFSIFLIYKALRGNQGRGRRKK